MSVFDDDVATLVKQVKVNKVVNLPIPVVFNFYVPTDYGLLGLQ